ncbi:unnamed protein product, partial [Laminaria digitata]
DARLDAIQSQSVLEFGSASAERRASGLKILDRVAKAAEGCPGSLQVEGHTDNQGDAQFNLRLSQARAQSVLEALVERSLPRARLRAVGLGAEQPIADNNSAAGRQKNRRIQIHVIRN